MSPDFSSFLSSEIFELTAEKGERKFLVHSDILTAQSAPLRALVTGNWRESADRKINLEDWDGDTVGRFVSFLYTGDYEYPDPLPLSPTSSRESIQPVEYVSPRSPASSSGLCMEEWEFEWLEDRSTNLEECIPPELRRKKYKVSEEARLLCFDLGSYDYRDALITHVKVYALAQYKDVVELRKLSLERLLFVLQRIGSFERGSHLEENIVELLSCVYEHTDELDHSKDPMRMMVSEFVANSYEILKTNMEMKELIKQGGQLTVDFLERIPEWIEVYEEDLDDDDWFRC